MALFDEKTRQFEAVIDRFEEAWLAGQRPRIDRFLSDDSTEHGALLAELVHIDLDWRYRAGETPQLEEYLADYPALQDDAARWSDLVEAQERLQFEQSGKATKVSTEHSAIETDRATNADSVHSKSGTMIGRFRLLGEVGKGSFGTVYRAVDTDLGREVAIKIPRMGVMLTEQQRSRFVREGRSMARLDHSGIVRVFEVGEHENVPYIVSEFVAGTTLADELAERSIPEAEACEIIVQLAEALGHAHANGIVHRDVKPSNVLLEQGSSECDLSSEGTGVSTGGTSTRMRRGRRRHSERSILARLTDFGLARVADGEPTASLSGQLIGTAAYMSPEQADGQRAVEQSDVFSLGVILYEMLTGERPFHGIGQQLLLRIKLEEPASPQKLNERIDSDLSTICMQCLRKSRSQRYASAGDLAADLHRWQRHELILARPPSVAEKVWNRVTRHPARSALVGVSLLAISVLIAGTVFHTRRLNEELRNVSAAQSQVAQEQERTANHLRSTEIQLAYELWKQGGSGQAFDTASKHLPSVESDARPDFATSFLGHLLHRDQVRWHAHDGEVTHISFSRCDKRFATSGTDRRVKVWDRDDLQHPVFEVTLQADVAAIAFDTSGDRLQAITHASRLFEWSIAAGESKSKQLPDYGNIGSANFSLHGTKLGYSARNPKPWSHPGKRQRIVVWNVAQGQKEYDESVDGDPSTWIALSHDGTHVALQGHTARLLVLTLPLTSDSPWVSQNLARCGTAIFLQQTNQLVVLRDPSAILLCDASTRQHLWQTTANHIWSNWIVPCHTTDCFAAVGVDNRIHFWDAKRGVELGAIQGCRTTISALACSPSGEWLVAGEEDGTVVLMPCKIKPDASAVKGIYQCAGPLAHSPDGALLAIASTDHSVDVWDTMTWERLKQFTDADGRSSITHRNAVKDVVFSPGGKLMATAALDNSIQLWEVTTGKQAIELEGAHESVANDLEFSSDSRLVAAACDDHQVRIWDVQTGKRVQTLRPGESPVDAVAFSADGKLLATGGRDGRVKFWSLPEFKQVDRPESPRLQNVAQMQFVKGRDWLLISDQGRLLKWEYENGEVHDLGGCSGPFSLSPNYHFVSAISHEMFRIVDLDTHYETHTPAPFAGTLHSMDWTSNGPNLAITTADQTLKIWNTHNWHVRRPLPPPIPPPTRLSYSTNGNALFVTSARTDLPSRAIREHGYASYVRRYYFDSIWLQAIGTHLDRYMRSHYDAGSEYVKFLTHDLLPRGEWNNTLCRLKVDANTYQLDSNSRAIKREYGVSAAISLPEERLLVGSVDGSLSIYDSLSGKKLSVERFPLRSWLTSQLLRMPERLGFEGANSTVRFGQAVFCVAIDPQGKLYAAVVGGGKLIAGDLKTDKSILQKLPKNELYQEVAYCDSPAGPGWIATTDHSIQLLEAVSLEPLGAEMIIESPVRSVAVSTDGTLVAAGREDHVVSIRSVIDGKLIRSLRGHAASVDALAFSPTDQMILVSGSADGTVRVWDLNTGVCMLTLGAHGAPINCVAFRPDGMQLATGARLPNGAGEVLLWNASVKVNDDGRSKKQ